MREKMREKALTLLKEHNKGEYRIFHALSVEGAMRYFAAQRKEDIEFWGTVGLLHDLDFEENPGHHCEKNPEMLSAAGYSESFIHAVQSHGFNTTTNVMPTLYMEKVLYTLNELVSLISESTLALPSQSINNLTTGDVSEKFDIENFALYANRKIILKGCEMLQMSFDDMVHETIQGMRTVAKELGLDGRHFNEIGF